MAKKKDFLEIDSYLEGGKKKWKQKNGVPYWLINSKGIVENKNYILNEDTEKLSFATYLLNEQVLIPAENV